MKQFEDFLNESSSSIDGDAIGKLKAQNKKMGDFISKLKEIVKKHDDDPNSMKSKLKELDWNMEDSNI